MANITERVGKNGVRRYQVQVRLKGHPKLTATFERLSDARRWAAEKEADIRRGRHFQKRPGDRVTLAQLIDRYLEECLPRHAGSDRKAIRQRLGWWKAELGGERLSAITPAVLEGYRERLERKDNGRSGRGVISGTTQRHYLKQLGALLGQAVKWRLIETNPMNQVAKPPQRPGRVRFLDREELPRFLAACRASTCPGFYAAVLLALSTGMRRGEMRQLTWERVDLERGHIVLDQATTKGRVTRGVPLTGEALAVLREHARVRRPGSALLFPGRDGRKVRDFSRPFAAALQEAGITDFRWHDLRHTAASYMVMSGASLATVGALLGHRTLQMTQRYAHLADDFLKGEVARMTARLFDPDRQTTS